ncbi:MAG: ATP-binding protein [Burkholderiales bacterium]
MSRLLPRSLFGRTLLVLGAGLLLAQAASVVVNLFDRGASVYRLASQQMAARIAGTARVLNRLGPAERNSVIDAMNGRDLSVSLGAHRLTVTKGYDELNRYERAFAAAIQRNLAEPLPATVEITARRPAPGENSDGEGALARWVARQFYFLLPDAFALVAQVTLDDGSVAIFFARVPQEPLRRYETLVPSLLLTLAIFFVLAALAARGMTRSLERLARAARALGENPEGPPLDSSGPREVASVIDAFNRMQSQVQGYVLERSRMLGAVSHDLKTPITRMRLRAEMLADGPVKDKFVRDLEEMEAMVDSTLEFFRSLGKEPQRRPVDVAALIDSLCEDWRESGRETSVSGAPRGPYNAHPQALRRCLNNLIENALRYGERADLTIDDDGHTLRIEVRDRGPGIPADQLETVFEPFFRLEASRSRASGGVGLGLSIARNIARWHGGDVSLRNALDGGLIAQLTLPREPAAAS